MKRHSTLSWSQLPLLLMIASAAGLTVALVPRGRELALLRMEAGDSRSAVAALERLAASGDRSPATLAALSRALAETGDPAGAARLLEGLVEERPDDRAVLEALAGYQRAAGRNEKLIHTLRALQAAAPRIEWQRELARLLGEAGKTEDRRQALRVLVGQFLALPIDYVALARSEQAAGDPAAGAAVLRQLAARHPQAVDASIVGLEISMLLASGEGEQALRRGEQWLQGRRDLVLAAAILGGALSVGGRPDLAVTLLKPHAEARNEPDLVAALAQAESDAGDPGAGLHRLERLEQSADAMGAGSARLLRLRLAMAIRDTDRAMAAAEMMGLRNLPPDVLAQLSRVPLTAGRADALRRILDTAGDGFLHFDVVLAAQIHLALGDREAAGHWSERAAQELVGQPERLLEIAAVEFRLGRSDRALELLGRAVSDPALAPSGLVDAARFYIRAGRAADGVLVLDALRQHRPSPAADSAWALAATASGRAGEVGAWFAADRERDLAPDLLRDLAYLAIDAGGADLAVGAAERLFEIRHGADEALLLARTLLKSEQPRRALDLLRALPPDQAAPNAFYEAVLLAAWRQHAPITDELRAIWIRHLAEATEASDREAAIFVLLELRSYPELVPVLRRLAEQDPGRWIATFSEVATSAGRQADLPAFWGETAMRPSVATGLRRQLAFRLLEAGDKPRAEKIFRALALNASPGNQDVRMLLFLWGPRPGAEQFDWIEARARRATGAEKAEWMAILTDRGAPVRAVATWRAGSRAETSEPLFDAYASALEALGDRAALAAAIQERLPLAASVTALRRLAQLAEQAGNPELERSILEKIVAAGDDRPEVRRRLGMLAFQRRNMAEGERQLSAFVSATGGDYETLMLLGNIALRKHDTDGARAHYANSLRILRASGDQSFHARTVEANLLHRLGRDDEAARFYEKQLAERPDDTNLRADFVAMLMEQGTSQRARAVLDRR